MRRISQRNRVALAGAGIASWAAGSVAAFLSGNGAGTAALVAVGGACGVLGLMGRWPSRVSISGNDIVCKDVKETVNSQIQADESATVLAELKDLRSRLTVLQQTGVVPEHPAQTYGCLSWRTPLLPLAPTPSLQTVCRAAGQSSSGRTRAMTQR